MDYKKKYLKYKNKYVHLKMQLGGTIELIAELKKLYPTCQYDNNILTTNYIGHKITYGEMKYEGLDILIQFLNDNNYTSFIDIGSGRGKLCIYMLKYPNIQKSIGIEIVTERHEDAVNLKTNLKKNLMENPNINTNLLDNVIFLNENILDVKLLDHINDTDIPLIWFSNLCFDKTKNDEVYNKLIIDLPNETIICSSQEPTLTNNLEKIGTIPITMSWGLNSNVYCYKIKKNIN